MHTGRNSSDISVVIGGTRGIGSAITNALVESSGRVITCSRSGSNTDTHVALDLLDEQACSFLIERLDGALVKNLIFCQRNRKEGWDNEIGLMLSASQRIIDGLLGSFSKPGSIVFIGSHAADKVFVEQSVGYHVARGGIKSLVRYLAVTLGPVGLRCNVVSPGTVLKPENNGFFAGHGAPVQNNIERITPLSRMGNAEDIAKVVRFLCSDDSSFLTGQDLVVDGGLHLVSQEGISKKL